MDRWKARCYTCGRVRVSIHPGGPEAWAWEHLEVTDEEHDVKLEFHEFDPEYVTPEDERGEFYPFPLYDFSEESVIHDPYSPDLRYYHEQLLEE